METIQREFIACEVTFQLDSMDLERWPIKSPWSIFAVWCSRPASTVLLNLSKVDRMVLGLNITILDVHETDIFEEIELRE
jgi:hypothetical protein